MTTNLALSTDAYHQTMGRLIRDPLEFESHVLYARSGGPLVVSDLSLTLAELLRAVPTPAQVAEAAEFWKVQRIPFPIEAWRSFAAAGRLPVSVRGLVDGEVALPGDPIAVVTGPAALVGAIEPLLIGEQMASLQLGTRLTKVAAAVGWDMARIFEVGLRAVDGADQHVRALRRLKRLGLKATSDGLAARELGLRAVGTMGHRFTQRFSGADGDYAAFSEAVDQMLRYREMERIDEALPLSFLLDTRDTLGKGFPAALRVIEERLEAIRGRLAISVRLDSGDMRGQFRVIAKELLDRFDTRGYMPKIIVESGLTAADVADFEALADETGFDRRNVFYGVGGYLVGRLDRDFISLVYKVAAFGGHSRRDHDAAHPVMKFGNEPLSGKESYPGHFELWERGDPSGVQRMLAKRNERLRQTSQGWRPLFQDLVIEGELVAGAIKDDAAVQESVRRRWSEVARNYVGDDKRYYDGREAPLKRPLYSNGLAQVVHHLREVQFGNSDAEVRYGA